MPLITKILQPERLNSAVISGYALEALRSRFAGYAALRVGRVGLGGEDQVLLDAVQAALDRLKAEGVIS